MTIHKSEEVLAATDDSERPEVIPPETWALAKRIANIQKPNWRF